MENRDSKNPTSEEAGSAAAIAAWAAAAATITDVITDVLSIKDSIQLDEWLDRIEGKLADLDKKMSDVLDELEDLKREISFIKTFLLKSGVQEFSKFISSFNRALSTDLDDMHDVLGRVTDSSFVLTHDQARRLYRFVTPVLDAVKVKWQKQFIPLSEMHTTVAMLLLISRVLGMKLEERRESGEHVRIGEKFSFGVRASNAVATSASQGILDLLKTIFTEMTEVRDSAEQAMDELRRQYPSPTISEKSVEAAPMEDRVKQDQPHKGGRYNLLLLRHWRAGFERSIEDVYQPSNDGLGFKDGGRGFGRYTVSMPQSAYIAYVRLDGGIRNTSLASRKSELREHGMPDDVVNDNYWKKSWKPQRDAEAAQYNSGRGNLYAAATRYLDAYDAHRLSNAVLHLNSGLTQSLATLVEQTFQEAGL